MSWEHFLLESQIKQNSRRKIGKRNKVTGINSYNKDKRKLGSKNARKDKNIDSLLADLKSRIVFLFLHTPCKKNLGAIRAQP